MASALEEAACGPLADALAKETKTARRVTGGKDTKSPAEVGLKAANYFDAFDALRLLHTAASPGLSAAISTDLARGYAHLDLLTGHLKLPLSKVCKARSLLYAHRAVALKSPTGRWVVAYACAICGLHARAFEQVKDAVGNPPTWARVVEPTCRFDHITLGKLAKDPAIGPVAGVLQFLAIRNVVAEMYPMGIGVEVLQADPDCHRVASGVI
jgi:hypothetical protein